MELLSPWNKSPGGYALYLSKRNSIIEQNVHLVELDLLTRGNHPPLRQSLPPGEVDGWAEEVRRLARARDAVVLAHNYERPEVQDVADFVGDSLGLSYKAKETNADVIAFCGYHGWHDWCLPLNDSVPAGLDSQGLPLGLQLIGRPFDEETLFSLGHVIEKAAGNFAPHAWW